MSQPSSKLERTLTDAKRAVVIEHIRTSPSLTLGDIVKIGDGLGDIAKTITVADIMGQKAPSKVPAMAGARAADSKTKANVKAKRRKPRSKAAVAKYEAAVLDAVRAAGGPVGAQAIREKVGGDPNRVRAALKRWATAKKIKRKGQARATTYTAR